MRCAIFLALAVLAGCANDYYLSVDGDVRGAQNDTPRTLRADIYDESGARARGIDAEAYGPLAPLPDARVSIGLLFGDEHEARRFASVPVDSLTAGFHFQANGEDRELLTGFTVHVEAPGYWSLERTFTVPEGKVFDGKIIAVMDPVRAGAERQRP